MSQPIHNLPRKERHPFPALPKGNDSAIRVALDLVCTAKHLEQTAGGGMRQSVFKELRDDKSPDECKI